MTFLKKILKRWYVFIGLLIFLFILYKIDLSQTAKTLLKANIGLIILAILVDLLTVLIQAKRWHYVKKVQNINYDFKDSFLIYGAALFFSTTTPGHLGDFIKVFYLKKDGYSIGKSLVSVFLDRFADLSLLLLIGYVGMCFFARFFLSYIIIFTLLVSLVLFSIILFKKKEFPRIIVKKIIKFIIPERYQESFHLNYRDFIQDLKAYKLKNYLVLYSITVANWLVYFSAVFILAKSVGIIEIPFIYLAMSITIATLATLIPISVSGLGTRDAVLLFLFSFFSVNPEKTISFSILYLLLFLVVAIIGLVCWLKKPLKITASKSA